ncbi:hypothetical protein COY43_00435 [Candidatus Berkelbacteria bacterium CG_4_10_14_0_8_um_filter_35_9_33_8]|uniref:Uncharacterized protein n=1 Tax=Candidatus Berkelbacteria bacterium CG_4_10_14_0_2_um_filter_35_9_33_12 TaxID=1974499 RepID=A0A2M7W434_9BACT|nr:MAG: hypothetical protein COX10_02145 [Candidatus Berkelbacteria bacterium CG23_combo_of_CG06-09_8_20_14_all_33_15]PIS08234.1 MAG: hypothetical protein COT76_02600 [Candidatus Berkelbacteria bacterium CG10_big_fil_rev_8_21_14_0_10_33_10]PIZ28451.1 MAG: hypothetical protein COY43_00435 [Candidatus Berkelbacteria bacterium CG_4_10_14_0_8_um_filter_35_9_33_8]PJA20379.1 MAG: hypothetical protein COX60_01885 [Candidatus Berkelbacteria bacterium CG_4_10_14_0_2_um_filter_35_9_33_12]
MIPKEVIKIVKVLQTNNYIGLIAGGAVRDLVLDREINDYDIVTNADYYDLIKIFDKVVPYALEFGVNLIVEKNKSYEITLLRKDFEYSDGRRPKYIERGTLKEDAMRRDFTINALFYDPIVKKFIDYVNGINDLKNKVIRFVGVPEERINEDNLRLLRAIRIKNQLNFNYENETLRAIISHSDLIKRISSARVGQEMAKILLSKNRSRSIKELSSFGILKFILPEITRLKGLKQPDIYHQEGDVLTHTFLALSQIDDYENLHVILATLFHDCGKFEAITYPCNENDRIRFNDHAYYSASIANQVMTRFNYSKVVRQSTIWLIKNHMSWFQIFEMSQAKKQKMFNHPLFSDLIKLAYYDAMGTYPQNIDHVVELQQLYQKEYRPLPKRLLNGNDLIELSIDKKLIGNILEKIYNLQINGKIRSRKEALKKINQLLINR